MTRINGVVLFNCFVSGYESVLAHRNGINDINVFPVADGDTGSNMASTLFSITQAVDVSRSVSRTLAVIADRALSGARGNSGIIIAQFLNGFASECTDKETLTAREIGDALKKASASAYRAVDNPREGTLITVLGVWSEEMDRLAHAIRDVRRVFGEALVAARSALGKTTEQLDVLKKANVVDAGASGFVVFLEGIAGMIASGPMQVRKEIRDPAGGTETAHDIPDNPEAITFAYCAEALLLRTPSLPGGPGAFAGTLRERLKPFGDALIVSEGRQKTKVHIHTDDPAGVFFLLRDYGRTIEQKVDDMRMQHAAAHHPISKIAIVTDSIADIPKHIIERYQIHVIPMKILWGDEEYLDRLTITAGTLYPYLDARHEYPGSSFPDPRRMEQTFSWLSLHYEAVIAIPVGKKLSGCFQAMENAAKKLSAGGYRIAVVDSRLNSAAQGLAVLSAAEDAAAGFGFGETIERLNVTISAARIFVCVATFRHMVRGGRVGALKGFIAAAANLTPVVTLDRSGKGIAFGASFSQTGGRKKILRQVTAHRGSITRYAVVHAAAPGEALSYAKDLEAILGKKPEYVMEISAAVGIHAGIGAVAVAYI